ncbi:hypothetical protein [Nonomuraea sp. NPDC050202]|jgi:O-methyltransferase involved in polyketide biosynthesis|uniref:hypothetical protein n=1 Tax=Nonomuraea sp. NPDC050202 TaxID=3155035 RepID=UPI00340BBFBE
MSSEKVHLTGEKATLLATLYGRALDATSPHPILGDRMAAEAIERIDQAIHPGLRCLEAVSAFDIDGFDRLSAVHRTVASIIKLVPALRRTAVFYRLEF